MDRFPAGGRCGGVVGKRTPSWDLLVRYHQLEVRDAGQQNEKNLKNQKHQNAASLYLSKLEIPARYEHLIAFAKKTHVLTCGGSSLKEFLSFAAGPAEQVSRMEEAIPQRTGVIVLLRGPSPVVSHA